MATRTKRSPEEIKAWRAKMGDIARQIRGRSPEELDEMWRRFGTVTAEGRRLSPFNVCFLAEQCFDGTPGSMPVQVGGFRQWQKVGRVVREGETACGFIWVPIGKRTRENKETGESEEVGGNRFRLVPMFDVRQTEAIE